MTSWVFALWIGIFALAAPHASADETDACVDRAIDAIQRRYQSVRDLSARFEQTSHSVALGSGAGAAQKAAGRVWFAKPGKMRWSYEEPQQSLVVSDGSTLWIYDPEQREAQRLPVGEGYLSGAAIQFLLGEGEIRSVFQVHSESCSETAAELSLVPREPATYERLRVNADPRSGELLATRIVDLLGNATEVRFSDIAVNQDPGSDVFTFEAPEGVRVIELEPMPNAAGR